MKQLLEVLSEEMGAAFAAAGYDESMGRVSVSARPDLAEYQCNGAMAGAKTYHKAPFVIAQEVAAHLEGSAIFADVSVVKPGFINVNVSPVFLRDYLQEMSESERFGWSVNGGCEPDAGSGAITSRPSGPAAEDDGTAAAAASEESAYAAPGTGAGTQAEGRSSAFGTEAAAPAAAPRPKTVVLDYGGPNVAKPLHVGHLRSAVIGESLKRIVRYHGDTAIGDIHMGDWGLQMGLVITEVRHRHPDLPYFDPAHTGDYPKEAPFTVSDLEEIYPFASARSKEDKDYYAEAMDTTARLQSGDPGCRALWQHIMDVSVADMKRNYANLDVTFDLWNGESTVNDIIPGMARKMKEDGYAYESQGALVVDVSEPSDAKEIPPCMILKSDGAALYTTTDLATIQDRRDHYHPDEIIYITDKRQALHFTQVFRTAKKCGLCDGYTRLRHVGFGTVNGKDGKPFKTREGGVMRLETLIEDIYEEMLGKITSNPDIPADEAQDTARKVALAAIKYGDLSNQAAKDYSFDMEKFTSFEGDTGPYILYTIVRIKSILTKYAAQQTDAGVGLPKRIGPPRSKTEKDLMRDIAGFSAMMQGTYDELAPHRICAYIYQLANDFNSFYHETRILTETDFEKKDAWIALLLLTKDILETCIDLLGFEAPERM